MALCFCNPIEDDIIANAFAEKSSEGNSSHTLFPEAGFCNGRFRVRVRDRINVHERPGFGNWVRFNERLGSG